jgi:hypothetical protein
MSRSPIVPDGENSKMETIVIKSECRVRNTDLIYLRCDIKSLSFVGDSNSLSLSFHTPISRRVVVWKCQ